MKELYAKVGEHFYDRIDVHVAMDQRAGAIERVAAATPEGEVRVITDNLASHTSPPVLAWLAGHPRIQQVFIPVGACWLSLQEACVFLRVPEGTLRYWRHLGAGPRSFKVGRHVRYWRADLVLWLTEQTNRPQGQG